MATIKAIEGRSIHQIQSGQVIVDLNSVVKELVENSLDAGATSIDIRFKNNGLDCIEVQDNGKGIAPEDYATIALKHHTSKLSSYEDLTDLSTFGFRGEALSSLCALSRFHILTARAEEGAIGKRLDFLVSGALSSIPTVVAAQKGTTVTVSDLFYNLPVRRKELERNIKREYGKVLSLLQAYACISVGVRVSISNQMTKGRKTTVFSTKGNPTTKENIVNVFGAKTLVALCKLDLTLEMEPNKGPSTQGARNWSTQATDRNAAARVEGHVSRPVVGDGRNGPDRQMFFVNSRPCGLPQVAKIFNEVYKGFNVTQSPFVFANLIMDTQAYDVNVSPDKRTILLHDQTALLAALKVSLTDIFEGTEQTMPASTALPKRGLPGFKPVTVARKLNSVDLADRAGEDESEDDNDEDEHVGAAPSGGPEREIGKERTIVEATRPSLMQDWIGQDTELRREKGPPIRKPSERIRTAKHVNESMSLLSNDCDDLEVSSSRTAEIVECEESNQAVDHVDTSDARSSLADQVNTEGFIESLLPSVDDKTSDPMSIEYDDLFSQRPTQFPRPTALPLDSAAPSQSRHPHPTPAADARGAVTTRCEPLDSREHPIAATNHTISQKSTPGAVESAFDRMRPKRTPLQTAEITIGNITTTTTTLGNGSPAYKKRRVYQPMDSQAIAKFGASPLLARGLKEFAAAGSQLEIEMAVDSSDVVMARRREDGSDSASEPEEESEDDCVAPVERTVKDNGPHSDAVLSHPLDTLSQVQADEDEYDEDYIDERDKKIQEDAKIARMIQDAENELARPSDESFRRASQVLKGGVFRKDASLNLTRVINTSTAAIKKSIMQSHHHAAASASPASSTTHIIKPEMDSTAAESRLSLTISKADFARMRIVGQFNLGFVLAVRPASSEEDEDELFIIDQHAADEKYNYERLQRTVTLQSQRLVRPLDLDLTAVEREMVKEWDGALKANGFVVEMSEDSDESPTTTRLLTLPLSGSTTFTPADLSELLHLLSEAPANSTEIPRPRKVQKMLAMRACRSSIMVGRTLTIAQMERLVRHMGEMERPWNCPHGRPTMRHLAGLGGWRAWGEGSDVDAEGVEGSSVGEKTNWRSWVNESR